VQLKVGLNFKPRDSEDRSNRHSSCRWRGSQSVETVQLKRPAPAAGAGGEDFGGVSVVEGADSESPEELLEKDKRSKRG